ncbi:MULTISPECIES: ATP-binding cassette domain-containing protein [Sorangium]|uniref:ATP-binding cassette domain-containing protein n=1 Tax=Sorangium TaxID=39643 RepID=UPI003D9C4A5C
MSAATGGASARFFIPEVVQTSAMDCGPAALKGLLDGFGIHVSYGRLREACQTDLDGTSIDTLEDVAVELGLDAEQTLVPVEHLLAPEARALPALVITRLSSGANHFMVVWRRVGPLVQVMDPSKGRRWVHERRLLTEIHAHTMPVSAETWRGWAGSEDFLTPLRSRMRALGVPAGQAGRCVGAALADPTYRSLAALDAATRLLTTIARAGGLRAREGSRLLDRLFRRAVEEADGAEDALIPPPYWSVRPAEEDDGRAGARAPRLLVRGAVLVRVRGRRADAPAGAAAASAGATPAGRRLSLAALSTLREPPPRPLRELARLLREDGVLGPTALVVATAAAAGALWMHGLMMRQLAQVGAELGLGHERVRFLGLVVLFVAGLFLLQIPLLAGVLRMGRRLEIRMRVALLAKIPRLGDRYFHSRLRSDMAERSHSSHQVRLLPVLGAQLLVPALRLAFCVGGIAWIDPLSAAPAALLAVVAVGLPLAVQPVLSERDLRVRTHAGALSRFYLDSLIGLVAVRTHGAERSIRREHESLLFEWAQANLGLQRVAAAVEALQALAGFGLAAWLLHGHLARGGGAELALLLSYWALALPVLGSQVAQLARIYPNHRSVVLRLLEPLGAPEEEAGALAPRAPALPRGGAGQRGVAIEMRGVGALAAGHAILEGVDLRVEPGAHVAIVGRSGAGKSSLVGLLLGWHRPSSGEILVDGERLDDARLQRLRLECAWVDPAIQLWNRSLLANLQYGAPAGAAGRMAALLDDADLSGLLEGLPEGLQTPLGEGGGLVSGGEGQRVRFGRALARRGARLVILDEPFRGLDREKRRALLGRARAVWKDATVLCITHDVEETQGFDSVVVVEGGRIVEQGAPGALAAREGGRYRGLLASERAVWSKVWRGGPWRRIALERGRIVEPQGERTAGDAG